MAVEEKSNGRKEFPSAVVGMDCGCAGVPERLGTGQGDAGDQIGIW